MKITISFFCLLMSFGVLAQAQQTTPKETKFPDAKAYSKTKLTYIITNAPNNTYCYDIYANGKMMIHQPSIPAIKGNEGF